MITRNHPVPGVASAQGLDVSNYQGSFDWAAAKRQIPDLAFGVFRLTQGLGGPGTNSPDPAASHNHAAIRDAGLHRMAYHFLDPRLDGTAQARYFVDTHNALGLVRSDTLWLDNEDSQGLPPAAVSGCAQEFMAELVKLRPENPRGVYTFINFDREGNCAGLGQYPLWLAYPSATAPTPPPSWSRWTFWQWGTRKGTDADAFNGTAAQLDAWIASFQHQPPPAGGYTHLTKPGDTVASLAASRNMTVDSFISEQARLATDSDRRMWAAAPLPPGLTWRTVSP